MTETLHPIDFVTNNPSTVNHQQSKDRSLSKDHTELTENTEINDPIEMKDYIARKDKTTLIEKITPENYYKLYKNHYTISQLKIILKENHLKLSGTKQVLLDRLYSFFQTYKYAVLIQKMYRGYLHRKSIILRGNALKNRSISVNTEDFLTMDEVKIIPVIQFYSYTTNNSTFSFDMISIYKIISSPKPQNPYNREIISQETINEIQQLIRISRAIQQPINLSIPTENIEISLQKSIELRALDLFQTINSLGNYSEPIWFLSLTKMQLLKFYRELFDIWNYRASLTDEIKKNICFPNGNPFNMDRLYIYTDLTLEQIQTKILTIIDRMINMGIDQDSKSLGAYYVLASLTLVSYNAATTMPWLYQSVAY